MLSTDKETMKSKASLDDYIFLLDELHMQTLSYCEQHKLLILNEIVLYFWHSTKCNCILYL
jgi:hypothetical protein